jgi:hypothetical protein
VVRPGAIEDMKRSKANLSGWNMPPRMFAVEQAIDSDCFNSVQGLCFLRAFVRPLNRDVYSLRHRGSKFGVVLGRQHSESVAVPSPTYDCRPDP